MCDVNRAREALRNITHFGITQPRRRLRGYDLLLRALVALATKNNKTHLHETNFYCGDTIQYGVKLKKLCDKT